MNTTEVSLQFDLARERDKRIYEGIMKFAARFPWERRGSEQIGEWMGERGVPLTRAFH